MVTRLVLTLDYLHEQRTSASLAQLQIYTVGPGMPLKQTTFVDFYRQPADLLPLELRADKPINLWTTCGLT